MTKQQEQRPTAKIYVFPTRPRTASGGHRQPYAQQRAAAQLPTVACGSGWYHDAAIEEEAEVVGEVPYLQH